MLSIKAAGDSVRSDVVLEHPRYFMLTERMDSVLGGAASKSSGSSM